MACVSGDQIAVLVLLIAAFVAGYVARGDGGSTASTDASEVPELPAARAALERLLGATAAVARVPSTESLALLSRCREEFEAADRALEQRLGFDDATYAGFDEAANAATAAAHVHGSAERSELTE
jgi:hypothetical protein